MLDIHIDDFCKDSALVLKTLYCTFPRRSDVFVEDIMGSDELDEFGMHSRRHQSCLACMLWLAEEGLIKYNGLIQLEGIDQAVLTNRALSLLCSTVPQSVQSTTTQPLPSDITHVSFIEHMQDALASQSSQRVRDLMIHFFNRLTNVG